MPDRTLSNPALALDAYRKLASSVRQDLAELESSPSYLALLDPRPGGVTERKFGSVGKRAVNLWQLVHAVDERIAEATELGGPRGSKGRFSAKREGEVRAFLNERFVACGEHKALRERIEELSDLLDDIRNAAGEIESVWMRVLPRIDTARSSLDQLRVEEAELGVTEPLLGRVEALATDLAGRLVADPASVHPDDGDNLDTQVAQAADQIASLRAGYDNLDADLRSTRELLDSLRVLLVSAEAARQETLSKIVDPSYLVRLPSAAVIDGPNGLAVRLERLVSESATASWVQKRAMLDRWLESARKLETQLVRAEVINRAPIEVRNELRGRLAGFTAKMAGTGRAEDLVIDALVQDARAVLYNAPTDLAEAEAKVADLAARLHS